MRRGAVWPAAARSDWRGITRAASLITRLWNGISRAGRLLAGSFIFCEADAFREVGGFSNELFAGEEIDLSRRLKQLARARRKRIVILHRHPLVTSARKIHLYTPWEHLRFLAEGGAVAQAHPDQSRRVPYLVRWPAVASSPACQGGGRLV